MCYKIKFFDSSHRLKQFGRYCAVKIFLQRIRHGFYKYFFVYFLRLQFIRFFFGVSDTALPKYEKFLGCIVIGNVLAFSL